MTDRLRCEVPHCRCTTRKQQDWTAWICRKHWVLTSKRWRTIRTRAKRAGRRDLANRIWWTKLRPQAIERALGL